MILTGNLEVHKTDNLVRKAEAVKHMPDGAIAVWDTIPEDAEIDYDNGHIRTGPTYDGIVQPDIIAGPDHYQRVERSGHSWSMTNMAALRKKAEEREDVDVDELPDSI